MCCSCGGADSRARHCTGETNGPSLKWQMPPNCHCEERSDVAISGRHSQIVQAAVKTYRPIASVAALTERLVQGYSTAQGHWCTARHPDVSLRGAKRRGNLAVPGRTTGKPSAKSQLPPRDCTPRALPRASRSGRHVGLRPPRNDKLGGLAPLNCCCTTCNCLRRSGSAAAAEPSKYPGMHPRKCGKAVAVGGFTKRSKKTSVWVLTKLRLGGIVSLALRGTEC